MAPTTYTPPINTYVPLESIVLTNAASSVTFFNIAQSDANGTYKDLVIVFSGSISTSYNTPFYLNGDTTAGNYSKVSMYGTGASAATNTVFGAIWAGYTNTVIYQVMDYSASDKHTTVLARSNGASNEVSAQAIRWANTAPVTSFTMSAGSNTFTSGSSFTLFALHG